MRLVQLDRFFSVDSETHVVFLNRLKVKWVIFYKSLVEVLLKSEKNGKKGLESYCAELAQTALEIQTYANGSCYRLQRCQTKH